jgi:transcriptional regulator with XRE-family HTH domain
VAFKIGLFIHFFNCLKNNYIIIAKWYKMVENRRGKLGGCMELGPLIKYYRTQRGLTQKQLSKGICSIPHLSKIENNSKEANDETISLLLERLHISFEEMEEKEESIKVLLGDLIRKINFYLKNDLDETFNALKELEHIIPFSKYIYTYELYKYRYLLFKDNLREAENQRSLLDKQKKNFSQHEMYLFRYYNAVCLIMKGQFKSADELLEALYSEFNHESVNGDFFYHRAIVKGLLNQNGHAIHFGKMALQSFMEQHNFIRILHTLMLLGINYTNSNIYEEAQVCFQHLIRNAELLNEEKLLPQIYHNMAFLQNKKNNRKEALMYYEKSLSLQSSNHPNYLVTLHSIADINYSLQLTEKARKGFLEVNTLAKEQGNKKYKLLSDFYLMHLSSEEKAFKYLESKVIPYLEETKQNKEDLIHFYKMLSEYYRIKGSYLEAFNYLNKIT